jgi:hypothetical protein
MFRLDFGVEDLYLQNLAPGADGEKVTEGPAGIVVRTGKDGFEDDIRHGVEEFPPGGVEFSEPPYLFIG